MVSGFSTLDFNACLFEYYKKLGITEDELVVLLMVDYLKSQGNDFITNEILALKMNFEIGKIDKVMSELLTKGYMTYISNDKTNDLVTSIDPLKKQLYEEFSRNLLVTETNKVNTELREKISQLYSEFEKAFSRSLSPIELSRIDEWINAGIPIPKISYALKEASIKGRKTIKSIDNILLKNKVANDMYEEGYSFSNNTNDVLDEQTKRNIEILKTKFTDTEDDDK